MKSLIAGLFLFLNFTFFGSALATGPEYFSSRNDIIELAHFSDKNVSQEMIYLGVITPRSGFVVPYRMGLKIQDLVAMTSYKQSVAGVTVLRKAKPVDPVFDCIVKPGDKTNFTLQPGDVVWITDPNAARS